MKEKRTLMVLLFFMLLVGIPSVTIKAASLKIKMNGSVTQYTGTQVKAKQDGISINISNTPGILVNGIALLPYEEVFEDKLDAVCSYNSSTGAVTFKQYGNTVKLTIDSKIAYVNGKKATLSVAPRKVYYYKSKVTKVLVPSRFVAEALGYTYYWEKSTSTVKIQTPYALYYDKAWHVYKGTRGSVTINGKTVNVSSMPTVIFSNNAFVQAKKVFTNEQLGCKYTYNAAERSVTIQNEEVTVLYYLDSTTAYVNGTKYILKTAPKSIKNNVSNKSCIMVPASFTAKALGYDYTWNSSKKISQITVNSQTIWSWKSDSVNAESAYTNTLHSIQIEKKDGEEYISFDGEAALTCQSVFTEEAHVLTITISDLKNAITAVQEVIEKSSNIKKIVISECVDGITTIELALKEGAAYYESVAGSNYTIHFCTVIEPTSTENSITLPIPDTVSFSEIEEEDCYYNKQFKVMIPGNYVSYYQNIADSLPKYVSSASCSVNSSGNTVITFKTTKILGYKLTDNGTSFTITVGSPSEIYSNIVVLDPGHGGTDPGCISHGLYEKNINFNILYKYCKEYFDNSAPVKAYWTRTTDVKIGLTDRAAFAKSVEADLFISLHMNSASSSAANGTETYYCTSNNAKNSSGVTSKVLAAYFQNNWSSKVGFNIKRGVRTANYVVIKKNTVPAILVELGFLSGSTDVNLLGSNTIQKKAAQCFYDTVCDFFEKYPTGR